MLTETKDHTTEEIEYLRHGDRKMILRLFRPTGAGPFPLVIDLHGGAWCGGHMDDCTPRDEVLTEGGLAAAALDFRHADDGYPTSLIDINYAVRWLKANAGDLRIDPDRIGLCGQSSGGHLAMLAAMRPFDSRYASIPLPAGAPAVDAKVRCVAMLWPVINPISRYRHAHRGRASANPPAWIGDIPERQDRYWKTEEAMTEGNPITALESGEAVETPPAIWVQGKPDDVHDYLDPECALGLNEPERFAHDYRAAGGEIEMLYIDYATRLGRPSQEPLIGFFNKRMA